MKLIIASNNPHKIVEIRSIVGDFFEQLLTLKDLAMDIDVEETGKTFEENALIKARAICALTGVCALADDSGLCVDALNGAPGVYSARYAGDGHNDEDNNALLLKNMAGESNRRAYFESCIALCYPNGEHIVASGRTYGEILISITGEGGFGYDPLFFSEELGKSFGEASPQEKNSVSHRARALIALKEKLIG